MHVRIFAVRFQQNKKAKYNLQAFIAKILQKKVIETVNHKTFSCRCREMSYSDKLRISKFQCKRKSVKFILSLIVREDIYFV